MTIIIFIAVLAVLVLVHEAGHFFVARAFKIRVFEFGFGFPPRLIGWKKIGSKIKMFIGSERVTAADQEGEGTTYSLNALPIGGFVRIYGEGGEDADDPKSFAGRPLWQRAAVVIAGVACNVVLAWVLFSATFMTGLPSALGPDMPSYIAVNDRAVRVVSLEPGSAAEAVLQSGDVIVRADDQAITDAESLPRYVQNHGAKEISMEIRRGEELERVVIRPRLDAKGIPRIGVEIMETGTITMPWYYALWEGARITALTAKDIVITLGSIIANLVRQRPVSVDLAGPVGIAVMTGQVARLGFTHLVQFIALLSVNLALINILSIPALDGGRFLFLIIERLRGKAMKATIERAIHTTGFVLLLALVLAVTYHDIARYGGGVLKAVGNLFQ